MSTIDYQKALEIAKNYLDKNSKELQKTDNKVIIEEEKTIIKEYGWVFYYTTQKYLETKENCYLVCGAGPLFVSKSKGRCYVLPLFKPPEYYLEPFEKNLPFAGIRFWWKLCSWNDAKD